MRTIVIEKNIYKFDELKEEVKEKVINYFKYDRYEYESYLFDEMLKETINSDFPKSNLKFQYSLNYCQGDGFNLYGNLSLKDILSKCEKDFSKDEINLLNQYINVYYEYIELYYNNEYCYNCNTNIVYNYFEDIIEELDYNEVENIDKKLVLKFLEKTQDIINDFCYEQEKNGYYFFYDEIDKEYVQELCDINDYEFLENGVIYND